MDKLKRFVNLYVPVTTCNLQCPYCYITQSNLWKDKLPEFKYSAEHIGKALSAERMGGICHLNICGGGETLLPPQMTEIIKRCLEQGHYIMIVTNGTVTKRFDELLALDPALLKRLGFKFSFHYLELKRKSMMDVFTKNIEKVKRTGCSYSIEMTPYDELIPYIDEIKEFCNEKFGAFCHVTVARRSNDPEIPILTEHSRDEYKKIWGEFDSDLFDFKMQTFNVKRKEFCYAGDWSLWLNIGTGIATQCYSSKYTQNIFENLNKPVVFSAVGKACTVPHCHNSHALLTLGVIPEMPVPFYSEMRNRTTENGTWLNKEMSDFLSQKLSDNNCLYSSKDKIRMHLNNNKMKMKYILKKIKKRF